MRRGIILAGGAATRLYPLTLTVSKQLMPVYDKPMIYYPLSVLMLAGLREILIITTPHDAAAFQRLLGDGSRLGLAIDYAVQPEPAGLPQAYLLAEPWLKGAPSALILGDNIFYGNGFPAMLRAADARDEGATLFTYTVADPRAYGVAEIDAHGRVTGLEEKPVVPRSTHAVTGLYYCDGEAPSRAAALTPSPRGELEITDLLRGYLADRRLAAAPLGRGIAWLDTGTHASLLDAAHYVRIVEERQGLKIGCPEEIAWRLGFIDDEALDALARPLLKSGYGAYLLRQLAAGRAPRTAMAGPLAAHVHG
ncbi:glucose-1-phosphate thymidylyltransferase RfbA [Sphingomonas morindae]|uniref:Glucose-1-phosphate thymidylyltransferase n=1 Tax=Sphingomonas morindae TaxID=1541170 RepID=A0ABY4X665_9SPHN|nr:glucose-1-phosphate thymidylyltransferase RfbA [Sphingomonas morindae]USI72347.1 glucose-1-phosphate thymidylyltransferase RfbA [Sphingomonas morindae]